METRVFWPFPPEQVIEWPGERGAGWATHIGTDWPVLQGTPVRASSSGTVDIHWNDGLGAWVIDIIRPDGFVVRGGHLSAMYPRDGQWVNAGDLIALSGGRPGTAGAGLSTGDHYHFELRWNQMWNAVGWVDPRKIEMHNFSELDKSFTPSWEDTMYPFSGQSQRKVKQPIPANKPTAVEFLDKHSDSPAGNITIARGVGDIVGLGVSVTLSGGKPGHRVDYSLYVERGTDDKGRKRRARIRGHFDGLGMFSEQLTLSRYLAKGELVRAYVHTEAGAGKVIVDEFVWDGFARGGAR